MKDIYTNWRIKTVRKEFQNHSVRNYNKCKTLTFIFQNKLVIWKWKFQLSKILHVQTHTQLINLKYLLFIYLCKSATENIFASWFYVVKASEEKLVSETFSLK